MHERIFLIGPMGAGKSTVGRKLAQTLRYDFVDLDQVLEQRTGVSVEHIFALEGESGFRARESKVLSEADAHERAVIATGGGVVEHAENRRLLRNLGRVVYLTAPEDILWRRVRDNQNRPLLQRDKPREFMRELLKARHPLYLDAADFSVQSGVDSGDTVTEILRKLKQN